METLIKKINRGMNNQIHEVLYDEPRDLVVALKFYDELLEFVNREKKTPKVFISGAITSRLDTYKKVFNKVDSILKGMGIDTYNPTSIDINTSWDDAMKITLKELESADFILVLKDWENSKGTLIEIRKANELGIPIHYEV